MTVTDHNNILDLLGVAKGEWVQIPELHSISIRTDGFQRYYSFNQLIKFTEDVVYLKYMTPYLTGTLLNYPKKKTDNSIVYFTLKDYNKLVAEEPKVGDTLRFYRNRRILLETPITKTYGKTLEINGVIPDNFDHVGIYKTESIHNTKTGPFVISLRDDKGVPFATAISIINIQGYHFRN